jgi:hypothetical protein
MLPQVYRLCLCFTFLWCLNLCLRAQEDSVLVFNEIMYHPADGQGEWVELVNLHGVNIDVSNWEIEGAISYQFPVGSVIPGNGYIVLASAEGQFPDALGLFQGRLDDDGERLRLVNNSGRIMSELSYNDRGEWPVAPDGAGVSLAKRRPQDRASDSASWARSETIGGTPGTANVVREEASSGLLLNEVAGIGGAGFFVEIARCPCPDPLPDNILPLEGYEIHTSRGESFVLTDQALIAGGMLAVTAEELGWENLQQGDRLFLWAPGGEDLLDAAVLRQRTRARFPDGDRWYIATSNSPGEANQVALESAVVINEIMYHHRPTYEGETPGAVFSENPEEWVEVTNRSEAAVDLTGWSLESGIRFDFPDGTMLAPGNYLVVARDAAALAEKYPDITILGDFGGSLRDSGDEILLIDSVGNPADEVSYVDGGAWPGNADAGGSSLELRHPASDNSVAGSWAASDESRHSVWKEYSYVGTAENPPGTSFPTQWDEFLVGMLASGECLLDDFSVIEDPNGESMEMIRNREFSETLFGGDGTQNWRFLGNHGSHGKTVVEPDPDDASNTVLHLVSTGPTEHMHNHLETTLSGGQSVERGKEYAISFRAKWLSGSPLLHTRLYFNYLAKKTILEQPKAHGTPGEQNSTYSEDLGPVYSGLTHSPAVAKDDEPISIRVNASDVDGIASLKVLWRTDSGEPFEELAMTLGSGDNYFAAIPGQEAKNLFGGFTNKTIHYYIQGEDTAGNTTWWPEAGPDSRVLIPLEDGRNGDGPGHNLRIVMTDEDTEFLHEETNVMSNDRILGTVIDRETDVYYNVGVRLKGSQRGRNKSVRAGFSLKMPADQLFNGIHATIAVDRSGAGDQFSQKEILVKHAINRAGNIPGMMDDLIYVISPQEAHTGSAMLLKARYDDEYLNAQFDNGSEGRMFEYELIYYPTSTVGGSEGLKRPNPDQVRGVNHRNLGPDKEAYRWHYLLENNRAADDYTQLMDLVDLFGSSNDDDYLERLVATVDVDQWLRSFAIQNLFGIGDNYSTQSQHNMIIYFPPGKKAMYFPWDMDFTFSRGASDRNIVANGDLRNMMDADQVAFRSYFAQMKELLLTVVNEDYMEAWATHYSQFLPSENLGGFVNYIGTRNRTVDRELRNDFDPLSFAITTNDGENTEVATSTITLTGSGSYEDDSVYVGDTKYPLVWTDKDHWELTLPLKLGENVITLEVVDAIESSGSIFSPRETDSITVINTGASAAANRDNVRISELMYHPLEPNESEMAEGFTNRDDFEFLELHNVSNQEISLQGARLTKGVDFDFTETQSIPAGGYLVLVSNSEAFQLRYPNVAIAGEYSGQLRNSGESVRLRGVDQQIIHEFSFSDGGAWPDQADGLGSSLTLVDTAAGVDLSDAASWSASSVVGGTPGTGAAPVEPNVAFEAWLDARGGDALADPDGDGVTLLEDYALGLDLGGNLPTASQVATGPELVFYVRTEDGLNVQVETSDNLVSWRANTASEVTEVIGDGTTKVSVSIDGSYARLRISS